MDIRNLNKLKEPYVLLLIGPPLCGKSTWIKNNFSDKEIVVISRDEIMMEVYGSDDYREAFKYADQKEVNRTLKYRMEDAGKGNVNTIVDMTNMVSKRRRDTLSKFGDHFTKVAIIFPIPDKEEMEERNAKRMREERKFIPENVLSSMISSYQPINKDREGFDYVVSI